MTELKPSSSKAGRKDKKAASDEALSNVIRLSNIPYGFFEKELQGYFSQFGRIKRVRVVRNKKGNHNGLAFVQFSRTEVAQIAAETMDNYIMADKRIRCKVLKVTDLPRTVKAGGLFVQGPKKNGNRIRDTKIRFAEKTEEQEERQRSRFVKGLRQRMQKIREMGIDYEFDFESKLRATNTWVSKKEEDEE